MSAVLQRAWGLQLLVLHPSSAHRRLFRKELRTLGSDSDFSPAYTPMKLRARASMDQHFDIHLPHPLPASMPDTTAHRLHHALNVSSRWIVVAIAAAVVVWRHDDQVLWALTGSILNAAFSKLLKKVFNQQRPLTALGLKADPGMPSSHAQSFGFLGLYAAIGVISWLGLNFLGIASASLVLLCGIYLAWLRFSQGLHTSSQVIVGAGFGCCMAAVWIALWQYLVREAVASSTVYHYFVVGFFCLSASCFIALAVKKWRMGDA